MATKLDATSTPYVVGDDAPAPTHANGLPIVDDDRSAKAARVVAILTVVPALIGFGLAAALVQACNANHVLTKIALVRVYDLQWLYLSLFVLCRTVAYINMYPMVFKARVFLRKSGNLRANMYIFKQIGDGAKGDVAVVLQDEGDAGMYNRANRSLHHFTESASTTVAAVLLAGFVYPAVTFALAVLTAIGAVWHQRGYSRGGYGKHGGGFGVRTLAGAMVEGLLLIVVFRGFGAW